MARSPSSSKHDQDRSLNRGAWTASEDKILSEYIKNHGGGGWRFLSKSAGLKRCGKSCRMRWLNYLCPDIKRGNISPEEDELLVRLHRFLGNRWSLIAGRLPGRTDNEIKNYWNCQLSKRVQKGEFDPYTFQKIKKRSRDMPSSKLRVVDKDNYTAQTLPLKTKAITYSGKTAADIRNLDRYKLNDPVQDTHDAINEEECLKAADHAVEIDTSKSWCQLLLEDCMGDDQHDRLDEIDDLQPKSMINTSNGIDDHHQFPSPSVSQSIILQENSPSSYCNLSDQEFPDSKDIKSSYFDGFLDLGEMSILLL